MSTINSKEINDKIASLPSRDQLSKEQQRQEDIAAINDYALRNPNKVFDNNFKEQRKHLTEETWKAVIQANPDMQDSASPKWRHIPNADIVNKYQGQAFSEEVRKAINEDGIKLAGLAAAVPGAIIGGGALAKPVLSQMFYHPGTFFAETIGGAIGGYAGGAATDAITRGVSDYDSFANMIASNSTIPEQYAEMLNPGMLLGGLAGDVGGNVLYNNVVKPTAQRAALPYLMAMQLNKNVRNANLGTTVFDDAVLQGKVGWSPKQNVVFKHGSENPDLQTFIPYETWDVKHRGASPYKYFVTEHGSPHNMMDDRPFQYTGQFDLEKPMVQIGEFNVNGTKNTTRNQLVQEARNRGADAYYMKDIYDNKANNQNVIIKFIDNQGETPYMSRTTNYLNLFEK